MIAPLSWLKDYVDITLTPKILGEKLTEIGLGTEKITGIGADTILELEITPNRPDLLSIIGVAREVAALESGKIKYPKLKTDLKPTTDILPLEIKTDPKINPRFTGIILTGITVKESPKWLKDKLESVGQRSINNIVDITNFVMLELGNPIHAFDYDRIQGGAMKIHQTVGGETFKSVDGVSYSLPKGAVVISDSEKIIDLCGIKGGENSGTFEDTKTIFIRVPVEVPNLIRRTSQTLGLRSEASSVFERGVNQGGTVEALKRTVDLVLELAGGRVASELCDLKSDKFEPWKLKLRIERLNKILGHEIPQKQTLAILENLNLSPKILKDVIECTIPTYRNDLKIEEDLIEEVARLYGYNKFPKTLPVGEIPTKTIPYFKDYKIEETAKQVLRAGGFSEIYTYSLISEKDLLDNGISPESTLRIDNPVSIEFEYLRPTLKTNLLKAVRQNKSNFKNINLFELGKVYKGTSIEKTEETYYLAGISTDKDFSKVKGILERLLREFGIKEDTGKFMEVVTDGIFFEIDFSKLLEKINLNKKFKSLPKYPPIVEDISVILEEAIKTIDVIGEIRRQNLLVANVSLLDEFEDSRTFHIVYQSEERNLKNEEVSKIREKIISSLKEKFNAQIK